jgi:hypothetical protein
MSDDSQPLNILLYIQEGLKGIAIFGSLAIIWLVLWAAFGS